MSVEVGDRKRNAVGEITFTLTDSNLHEGGRPRHPLEACMNNDSEKVAYLGDHDFLCETDDGERFEAHIGGTGLKNFRSRDAKRLGAWLKVRCRAHPGDEVHAQWRADGVLALRYVRTYIALEDGATAAQRRLERETEDQLVHQLGQAGVPYQRQVRVSCGVIDVLTPDALYEVKTFLTRDDMLKGVGQLLVYSAETPGGESLRRILVGRMTRETAALLPVLAKRGIEVDAWND